MNTDFKVSEVKLAYKYKVPYKERRKIRDSVDAYGMLMETYPDEQIDHKEIFKALYLNKANQAVGCVTISEGGISGTIADVRLIFQGALLLHATSIILVHNHPSGTRNPSRQDISLTKKAIEVGKIMEIELVDHLIITREGYYSLKDNGDI